MKLNIYTKLLFTVLISALPRLAEGQVNIVQNDTAICEGVSFTLHADVNGRTPVPINFQQNDVHSGVINIGFPFTFYGSVYNQCVVSPNGVVTFDIANANQPADNVVDQAIPGEPSTRNSIMIPYMALDIEAGGTVDYAIMGTAPNRRFIVTFCSVPLRDCNNLIASMQVVLYETSNEIDLHLIDNPAVACPYNFGRTIQGVQNAAGTQGVVVPGRNWPLVWFGSNDSHKFTPAGPGNYNVTSIPHTHIPDATATVEWWGGAFLLGTGPNYLYSFVSNQQIIARVSNCPDTSADTIDVIVSQIYIIQDSIGTNPSQCEAADGSMTLPGFFPGEPYDIYYTDPSGNPVTLVIIADASGQVIVPGLVEGVYTNIYARAQEPGQCRSNTIQSIELNDISVVIGAAVVEEPACNEDDGGIRLEGLVPGVTYTVSYDSGTVTNTVVLVADGAGNVVIPNLYAGTYTNITAATVDCNSNVVGPVTLVNILPVIAGTSSTPPSLCRAADATITLTGLAPDATFIVRYFLNTVPYQITLVADAAGNVTVPNLLAGTYYDISVQLYDCVSDMVGPVTIVNPAITADFSHILEPGCTEDVVRFTDLSTGSAFPFEYTWLFADGNTSTDQNPVHTYQDQGTYTVTLMITDSVCKDTVTHDVIIDHPLLASFTVDEDTICQGTAIAFTDGSTGTAPMSYFWDFGNGEVNSIGGPAVSSVYPYAGSYVATLIISDFINCKDTAYKYIRVDSLTEINLSLADDLICAGQEVQIAATYADSGSTGMLWDFGDGIVTTTFGHDIGHSYEFAGVYPIKVTATGRVCPDVEKSTTVNVQPQPIIILGLDTSMCPTSAPIILNDLRNASIPGAKWLWLEGDQVIDGETSFKYTVTKPGIYSSVVTVGECSAADSVWVREDCYIDMPNAFTPDGDNNSDYFFPRQWLTRGVKNFKMSVFNRWGNEVFSTTNIDGRGWDGKFNGEDQLQAVYVYIIEATFNDGTSEKKQGNVTLLR